MMIMLANLLLFVSCSYTKSYDYLMTHPLVLKKMMLQCDESDLPECTDVKRAAQDFSELVNERQDDPQQFGMKIMAAQQELANLRLQHATPQARTEQQQKINVLYAVVAVTSGG